MSQNYLTKNVLKIGLEHFKKLWEEDENLTNAGPFKDRNEVKLKIGNLYLRYVMLSNKFCEACEGIRDPLINNYARKYYEAVVIRVLQLNHELSRLTAEEGTNLDSELIHLGLTPLDVRLKIPEFYLESKKKNDLNRFSSDSAKRSQSEDSGKVKILSEIEKELIFKTKNQIIQKDFKINYQAKCEKEEKRIQELYKLRFEENIEDELREWCLDFYKTTGVFPPFPSSASVDITGKLYGIPKKFEKHFEPTNFPKNAFIRDFCGIRKLAGSALIPSGNWITPQEWLICQKLSKQKTKNKKQKSRISKKQPSNGFCLQRTEFFNIVKLLNNLDDSPVSDDRIESDAVYKIGLEVRETVDEGFRKELDLLEGALHKDKFPKRKRRKRKERKTKKGKKRKGILRDVSSEQCIEELSATGVLRQGYGSRLDDFITDFDYSGKTPNGKIADFLIQRCILPLMSQPIHQLSPQTRSVCLTGPCGKRFLVDAVITATAAAVFDLSPEVTSGYSKSDLKRLIAVVKRLSRELQPSVIFIRNIEKLFYKKTPAKEKPLRPKQLQPHIRKLVKGIKPTDRVLLMATSSQPWLGPKLMKCIDRVFYVPSTHYGSHVLYWKRFLGDLGVVPALAKISSGEGYGFKDLEETVGCEGIVDQLVGKVKVDSQKFEGFMKRTGLGKARIKMKRK